MKSLIDMLNELHEAAQTGTVDFSPWESGFIDSVYERANGNTTKLSDKQVEKIYDIYAKYFNG